MIRAAVFVVFLVVAIFASPAFCQQETITIDKPFVSRSLSGIVTDALGEPIPGVYVELKTHEWKRSLRTTKTNLNGWFEFKAAREGTYYLTIPHYSGFQEYKMKIRVTRSAKRTPKFRLAVAT